MRFKLIECNNRALWVQSTNEYFFNNETYLFSSYSENTFTVLNKGWEKKESTLNSSHIDTESQALK